MSDDRMTSVTETGRVLTDADIEALADDAERGHGVDELLARGVAAMSRGSASTPRSRGNSCTTHAPQEDAIRGFRRSLLVKRKRQLTTANVLSG